MQLVSTKMQIKTENEVTLHKHTKMDKAKDRQ